MPAYPATGLGLPNFGSIRAAGVRLASPLLEPERIQGNRPGSPRVGMGSRHR